MNDFKALLKVELKNNLSKSFAKMGMKKGGRRGLVLMVFLYALMFYASATMSMQFFQSLAQTGQPELGFTVMYIAASLFILFVSVSTLISTFYFSKDLGFLNTLPLKEVTIIFSKLAVQYIYSFFIGAIFLIPSLVLYWNYIGFNVVKIVLGLVVLVLAPLLPLLLATLIALLIMGAISKSVNRNSLTVVMGLLGIALIFGFQYFSYKQAMDTEFLQRMLLEDDGILRLVGMRFPPSVWATKMVTGDFLRGVPFLALNLVLLLGIGGLATPLYHKAVRSFAEGQGTAKVQKEGYTHRGALGALIRRNLLIIYKTPTFLLNFSMIALIPVIIFGVQMAAGVLDIGLIMQGPVIEYAPLILVALLVSPAFMGTFSASAITREGKYFWQTLIIPVSSRDNLLARVLTSVILSIISMVPLLIAGIFVLPVNAFEVIFAIVIALLGSVAFAILDLVVDVNRPILNWTNPTQAIKNNLNIMIALGLRLLLALPIILTSSLWLGLGPVGMGVVLLVLFGLLAAVGLAYFSKLGTEKFARIEI